MFCCCEELEHGVQEKPNLFIATYKLHSDLIFANQRRSKVEARKIDIKVHGRKRVLALWPVVDLMVLLVIMLPCSFICMNRRLI